MTQREYEKKQITLLENIVKKVTNTREEYSKKLLPLLVLKEEEVRNLYKNRTIKITPLIFEQKFELLENNRQGNLTKEQLQTRIDNYLKWMEELNKDIRNQEIVLRLLEK